MQFGWLSSLPPSAIAVGTLALILAAATLGRILRRVRWSGEEAKSRESEQSVAYEGYALGGVLGLLGLLLAFSFGMVLNRYEDRRDLAVDEANAIGTAYLRVQLLDEPHRSRLSRLFVAYTENRIDLATSGAGEGPALAANDRLLTEIWAAVRAARESALAHGLTTSLLTAVNEVIDLDAERRLAWRLRLPDDILLLLILYLSVTSAVLGYSVDGPRGRRASALLAALISLAIGIIADINRPMSGRARESQEAMRMLLRSLQAQSPVVFDVLVTAGEATGNGR